MTDDATIFDQIRHACAEVADMADDVAIRADGVEELADELADEHGGAFEEPALEPEYHYLGHGEGTVAYILALDTINFGSGYFPWAQPREGLTGYHMVADALREYFQKHGPPDPADLAEVDTEACARIFEQEIEHDARRRMMASFATAWRELGSHLEQVWDGSYTALVEAADGSAARLVDLLSSMSLFQDVVMYRNVEVPLFKRAQITASDLHIAFDGRKWGHFEDIDQLTAFADNMIPHVLRLDGVLGYSEELADHVDSRRLLDAATPKEIEIRACSVHAVERLVEALRARHVAVTPRQLDNVLWRRGQQDHYRVRPTHLTQTVFY